MCWDTHCVKSFGNASKKKLLWELLHCVSKSDPSSSVCGIAIGFLPPTHLELAPHCPPQSLSPEETMLTLMRDSGHYLISEQLSEDNIIICGKTTPLLYSCHIKKNTYLSWVPRCFCFVLIVANFHNLYFDFEFLRKYVSPPLPSSC